MAECPGEAGQKCQRTGGLHQNGRQRLQDVLVFQG